MIYTTNAIESLNARFRRATRIRGHFPSEMAALRILYLTIKTRDTREGNAIGRVRNWKQALNTLLLHYGDRIANHQ
jgi:transposase-like protein